MDKKFWEIKNEANDTVELLVYGTIDDNQWWGDVGAVEFAKELASITSNNITVRINSVGGNVFAGLAIYNSLRQHKAKITVRVDGLAASAASIIAMAGDEIIMPLGTMMMIHNAWTYAAGNAEQLRETADMLDSVDGSIVSVYKAKTGLSEDEIKDIMANDTWLSANEALSKGFATQIEDISIAASINGGNLILGGVSFELDKLPKNGLNITAAAGNPTKNKEEKVTFEEFKAKFSAEIDGLVKAEAEKVSAEAYEKGVQAERARMKGIDDLSLKGHSGLMAKAKYENPISAETLAIQIIKAEQAKATTYLKEVQEDANEASGVEAGDAPEDKDAQAKAKIEKYAEIAAKEAKKLTGGK